MTDILFISRQRIVGRTNGSSAYLLDLAEALRGAGMTPHLLQPSPVVLGRTPLLRAGRELDVFASHRIRGVFRIGRTWIARDPRVYLAAARGIVARLARRLGITARWARDRPFPYSVATPWLPADHAYVRAHSGGGVADVVIADYAFQAEGFASLADPAVPTAIVMHDLFHRRDGRDAEGRQRDSVALLNREQEIALLGRSDAVIAIQSEEAAFVAANMPAVKVILAPIAARPVAAPRPGSANRMLFVGSNTAPNVVSLEWFFAEVWPRIRAADAGISLEIAGSVARAFPRGGPEGTRFLGLVDRLDDHYARAGVVISPLTFGSGLKVKLVEAMANGKAIVATPITLQGVEALCRDALIEAREPAAFADACVRLAQSEEERARLAAASLVVARAHFAPEACYRALIEWVRIASRRDLRG